MATTSSSDKAWPKLSLGKLLGLVVVVAVAGLAVTSSSFSESSSSSSTSKALDAASALFRVFNITLPGLKPLRPSSPSAHILEEVGAGDAKAPPTPPDSSCTCTVKRLSGVVDDCCCDYETVDALNLEVLQPLLEELVQKPFFRYFKVRLWCDCPFWREDGMCHSRDCSVGECRFDEVPPPLRGAWNGGGGGGKFGPAFAGAGGWAADSAAAAALDSIDRTTAALDSIDRSTGVTRAADPTVGLSAVDPTVNPSDFLEWSEEDNPWTHDDETNDSESLYVDLVLNPERYTGYKGDSARRIWQAIYQESCFQDGPNDTCRERRVFFRLISGFHMSITVHVSTSFLHDNRSGEWGPHLEMFKWRVANFPDRIANLYFTYLFVLRAAMKASDYLSYVSYDTGNAEEDQATVALVRALVANDRLKAACPVPFDEAALWKGDQGPELFSALQHHFRNISALMDCVGCERCRLWGKLEILGLATAMKIVFSSEADEGPESKCTIALQRNEVTALINTLWRLSEALKSTVEMLSLMEQQQVQAAQALSAPGAASALLGPS